MTSDNDDPVLGPPVLGHNVVDGELSHWRIGRKNVVLYLIALEVGGDVVLYFLVSRASQRPRTERHNVFDVLHGAVSIDCWKRAIVCWKVQWLNGRRGRVGRTSCGRSLFIAVAGRQRESAHQQDGGGDHGSAHQACFSLRLARCLGCTSQATPMLIAYSTTIG